MPKVDIIPPQKPIMSEINGETIIQHEAPIIIPPAKEPLIICSAFIFPLCSIIEVTKHPITEVDIEYVVFTIALCFPFESSKAELKEGQYIHKNIVPSNENRFEWKDE